MVIFSNDRINEMPPAELAMLDSLGGPAVRDEGGGLDAQDVAEATIFIAYDPEVLYGGIVVFFGVGERLAVMGIVAPGSYRMSAFQDAVVNPYAIELLLGLVRVGLSPRDEGDGFSASARTGIDVAVGHLHVAYRVVGVVIVQPPRAYLSPRILVGGAEDYPVVVGIEETSGYHHVMGPLAEAETVPAHALHFMELDIADEYVPVSLEIRVVVVGPELVDVGEFYVPAVAYSDGADMDAVRAGAGVVAPVGIDRVGIAHPDDAGPGNLHVLDVIALKQGIVDEEAVSPGTSRNVKVVAVCRDVRVIPEVIGLPQDGSLFKMQVHVAPQADVGRHIPASVRVVGSWKHDLAAPGLGACVYRLLDRLGVVREGVAPRPVVEDVEFPGRKLELIGVFREIPPVRDVEGRPYFHVSAFAIAYDREEPCAQVGHHSSQAFVLEVFDVEGLLRAGPIDPLQLF